MRLIQGGASDEPVLSASAVAWLAANVRARVETVLPNPAAPDLPPGGIDYTVTFCLSWFPKGEDPDHPDLETLLTELAQDTGELYEEDSELILIEIELGTADMVIADVMVVNLFDALDARSQLLTDMYPLLFLPGDIQPGLSESLANPGASYAVLIEQINLRPAWQDFPIIASVCAGIALTELRRGCSFAAIWTNEPDVEVSVATDLGFQPWRGGISILDLGKVALDEQMIRLTHP